MADQNLLPLTPSGLERVPEDMREILYELYRLLASRLEDLITVGVLADRPAANGTFRFYFATDNTTMYFDDGTWHTT